MALPLLALAIKEIKVLGTFYGTEKELTECLELVSRGIVTPQLQHRKFEDLLEAVDDLTKGKNTGRQVFDPSE